MQWSNQQDQALKSIERWRQSANGSDQVFRLFGYAGTGKTTLAQEIASSWRREGGGSVLFACFTGKAALVLQKKGCAPSSTLHRLIYQVKEDPITGEHSFFIDRQKSPLTGASLLIVDEVSMVDEELAKDVLSFEVPVLVLGDPGQLPPIRGTGYFTEAQPNVMLTEIHRQAADNPIIRLATDAREQRRFRAGEWRGPNGEGARVISKGDLPAGDIMKAEQFLCGLNRTRTKTNLWMRARLFKDLAGQPPGERPIVGERLVCLKNKHDRGLLNGSLWKVTEIMDRKSEAKKKGDPNNVYMMLESLDEPGVENEAAVPVEFFQGKESDIPLKMRNRVDQFTFGYALTCHKSQGSQWDDVMVLDESWLFGIATEGERVSPEEMRARWLYTAVTRAAKTLTVVLT